MKKFTMSDHNRMLNAAKNEKATGNEKQFLGLMASLAAANEPVADSDYFKASRLAGINLHVEDSIFDRK